MRLKTSTPTNEAFSLANMTIGIDVYPLERGNYTGTERYLFELLKELKKIPLSPGNQVKLYSKNEIEALKPLPAGWSFETLKWPGPAWTHLRLSAHLLFNAPDTLFIPVHEIPLLTGKSKVVTTIHDLAYKYIPETFSKFFAARVAWATNRAAKKAKTIISISNTTTQDLKKFYKIRGDIKTIHLGVSEFSDFAGGSDALTKYGLEECQYFLFVGRFEWKKGVDRLIKGFEMYKKSRGEGDKLKLVLVGKNGFGAEDLQNLIDQSPVSESIIRPGFVSDEDLSELYKKASAFVFPTRFEGFGLPILEAMQYQVPVIATNLEILKEIGSDAFVAIDADNEESWVESLYNIHFDQKLREDLVRKGEGQVKKFTWSETAKKTAQALNW